LINVTKPTDQSLTDKWPKAMSAREIASVELVVSNELTPNGYTLDQIPISRSWFELLYYRMHQKIVGEFQLQYKWKYRDKLKNLGLIK
jgi:hypothetical protein